MEKPLFTFVYLIMEHKFTLSTQFGSLRNHINSQLLFSLGPQQAFLHLL